MQNKLIESYRNNQPTIGTFFRSSDPDMAEAIGLAGLDYLIIDTEHGPLDLSQVSNLLRATELRHITALVRVKDSTRPSILKMLDIGAKGLVIPNIGSLSEAKQVVEYGKYYPVGKRGLATARAAGFGYSDTAISLEHYTEWSNHHTLLIPQCETLGALEAIEDIVALPGIDGILVGPYDLSFAMGIPGEFDLEEFNEALKRVVTACQSAGKPSFIYAGTPKKAAEYFAIGYDSVAIAIDIAIYIEAYKNLLQTTRELIK